MDGSGIEKIPDPRNGSKDSLAAVNLTKDKELSSNQRPTSSQDEAIQLLSSHGAITRLFNANEDAQLLRKVDKHVMPIMFLIYFLQLMDKQTLSFSSVFGISRDAGLAGEDYSLLGSVLYIAQLIAQPLSAYLLVRLRLSIFVPIIVTCWGATLTCMAAATNFRGLLVSRFFLGVFEASIQVAFIITTQIWYRRHEQGFRLAIWYSNNGWVNIFGSLIMYGIGHIQSKVLHSYQIIFLVLGAVTFVVGLLSFSLFPDNPVRCKFFTTEEKVMAVERIRANQQGLETKQFKMKQVYEMFTDIKSWCWMVLMFLVSLPSGGITVFGPLIIRGFGFDSYHVMLLLIPFGALQLIVLFAGFWANRRFGKKSPILLAGALPCIIATVILLRVGRDPRGQPVLLAAYYLLSSYNVLTPTIMNWQSSNVAGHTKKSATAAFMIAGLISGNIVGPLLFTPQEKPYYVRGIMSMLISFCVFVVLVAFTVAYLWYLNKRNAKRRIAKGKLGKVVDYSMLSAAEVEKRKINEADTYQGGNHAFDDLTDIQNDEFIYVF